MKQGGRFVKSQNPLWIYSGALVPLFEWQRPYAVKVCDKDVQGEELSPPEVLSTEMKDNGFVESTVVQPDQ